MLTDYVNMEQMKNANVGTVGKKRWKMVKNCTFQMAAERGAAPLGLEVMIKAFSSTFYVYFQFPFFSPKQWDL